MGGGKESINRVILLGIRPILRIQTSETSEVFVKRAGVRNQFNKGTAPMGGLGLIFLLESFPPFSIITPVGEVI